MKYIQIQQSQQMVLRDQYSRQISRIVTQKMRGDTNTIRNQKWYIITDIAKMKSSEALSGYVSHGQIIQPL